MPSRSAGPLQTELKNQLRRAPALLLEPLLRKKLKDAGFRNYRKQAKELAEQAISEGIGAAVETASAKGIELSFDKEDMESLEARKVEFEGKLPELIRNMAAQAGAEMLASYRGDWPEWQRHQNMQFATFRHNLQTRWGAGLNGLRMLLDLAMQTGSEFHSRIRRSSLRRKSAQAAALNRLHCRACQIAGEIITLLENGYADGAMARWRTLHEVSTIALVVSAGDEDLSQRYFDHSIVDSKRALDTYRETHVLLGYDPPAKADARRTDEAFNAVVKKYGVDFATPFGWAAEHLSKKSPRFSDLEKAAGRAALRSHYKMASYNVHASSKALLNQLGLPTEVDGTIAGASNVGLEEPGQNTAFSLTAVTSLLLGPRFDLDDLTFMCGIVQLRDETVEAFVAQGRALEEETRGSNRIRQRPKRPRRS